MKFSETELKKWVGLLSDMKFFANMDEPDIATILDAGRILHANFHDYIFKEGDSDNSFFIIVKGSVKLIKLTTLHKKKEIGSLNQGDCFGEMGILLREKRTASVLAADDCFLFKITEDELWAMPDGAKAKLYQQFAQHLAERLKKTTESLVSQYSL